MPGVTLLFAEVRVTATSETVLLLREAYGARYLAAWITASGGNAILSGVGGGGAADPQSTHDLMVEALSVVDAVVESVEIVACEDGIFLTELMVNGSAVPCRISDGVALALRSGAPIHASRQVMDDVSIALTPEGVREEDPDRQVEEFREFLDQINADDFEP